VFVAYAAGMTLVLLALTVSLGMAKQGLLRGLRKALPYVTRASGVLLLVAGAYLVHYGWYERRVREGDLRGSRAVEIVTGWSDDIGRWVSDVGPTRLGLLLALSLLAVVTATFGLRARR
jgi:cytochrome c-type biogenesis protein